MASARVTTRCLHPNRAGQKLAAPQFQVDHRPQLDGDGIAGHERPTRPRTKSASRRPSRDSRDRAGTSMNGFPALRNHCAIGTGKPRLGRSTTASDSSPRLACLSRYFPMRPFTFDRQATRTRARRGDDRGRAPVFRSTPPCSSCPASSAGPRVGFQLEVQQPVEEIVP